MAKSAFPLFVVLALGLIGYMFATQAGSKPGEEEDEPARAARHAPAISDANMLRSVKSLETRACGCSDATCANEVLEQLRIWGRNHVAHTPDAKREPDMKKAVERTLECAKVALKATQTPQ